MSASKNWKIKALLILDQYEMGGRKEKLTQMQFAELLGVSRQTLWRDKEIKERFYAVSKRFSSHNKLSRRDSDMRARHNESQLEQLRSENNALIQVIMEAARLLNDHGIDPRLYLDDATK